MNCIHDIVGIKHRSQARIVSGLSAARFVTCTQTWSDFRQWRYCRSFNYFIGHCEFLQSDLTPRLAIDRVTTSVRLPITYGTAAVHSPLSGADFESSISRV